MKRILSFLIVFNLLFSNLAMAAIEAECLNDKGKLSPCSIENQEGNLQITYKNKSQQNLNKTIAGKEITRLMGGEYARRRVAESVTLGILIAPIALFGLFSKKKLDTFGVEYKKNGKPDSTMFTTKKKYGMSLKSMLQSVSGKDVVMEETTSKK